MKYSVTLSMVFAFVLTFGSLSAAEPSDADREHFFETKIRPILAQHCQECHGAKEQWAELRLDSHAFLMKGGESGPAVVPGNPDESRLIQVIRYSEDDSQMPPDGKLTDEQIASLTEWVSQGAYWPESADDAVVVDYFEQAKTHWAFQPVQLPEVPQVNPEARVANPVDAFIVKKLEEAGLKQSPQAEPRQQLRRLAFDLAGLPASYEDIQKFAADPNAAAWQGSIDRYLGSTDFGQKWARYWLDLARYADTKGYVFTEERRYPFAYTYRDYVIDALNRDLPYDQFVTEQLAADLMPNRRSDEALAGMGFLTVGNRFLNRTPDIFDDRIDVTMRGLMGLTLACARCHDHKFDPLEAADYYALYGVFDSCIEPEKLPQIGEPTDKKAYEEYKVELAKREQAVDDFENKEAEKINAELKANIERYLHEIASRQGLQSGRYELEGKYEIRNRARDVLNSFLRDRDVKDPLFGVYRRIMFLNEEQYNEQAPQRIEQLYAQMAKGEFEPHPLLKKRLEEKRPVHSYDLIKIYADLLAYAFKAEAEVPEAEREQWKDLHQAVLTSGFPVNYSGPDSVSLYNRDERNRHRNLEKKVDELVVTSAGAPPRAMVVNDKDKPASPVIFKRGNPGSRGDKVDRRFLKVLDFVRKEPFSDSSSGRLELAQAIVSKDNPLTARVLVNRVWMLLIGQPLVSETSDFGLRTAPPTHPELLDYLSYKFMENNWSVKWLIREIVTSETYRQSSFSTPEGAKADLENRLVWRMNRKRLTFEQMRDSILDCAGVLDKTHGGRSVQLEGEKPSTRRAIYGYIDRNNVSQLLASFDVASPNTSTSARSRTTVPQQALYVMNSPFVQELCQKMAGQTIEETGAEAPADKYVTELYQRLLQRDPSSEELTWCVGYLNGAADQSAARKELAQTLMMSNEFMFVD
ncbi:PSD1 and planctomycete cytochrome C domain-containing protein [Rubinisphaera margarita]|uniref:PSD1 and planctomycete cytochrome C domain-containing protein n=1 Tax=Rubinisphaera margarita TaxID=2909586 RepID=UPI001EE9699E|nr:PSD1 and planctomycete cytochrome C domain-containing protein [Rubinisphaera margarita]MCG6157450.1 PSD1 and planctomycete cytochrome C domain-containing protein [Rubinisphaera margarita]